MSAADLSELRDVLLEVVDKLQSAGTVRLDPETQNKLEELRPKPAQEAAPEPAGKAASGPKGAPA